MPALADQPADQAAAALEAPGTGLAPHAAP